LSTHRKESALNPLRLREFTVRSTGGIYSIRRGPGTR
jgi:hypothetical protein